MVFNYGSKPYNSIIPETYAQSKDIISWADKKILMKVPVNASSGPVVVKDDPFSHEIISNSFHFIVDDAINLTGTATISTTANVYHDDIYGIFPVADYTCNWVVSASYPVQSIGSDAASVMVKPGTPVKLDLRFTDAKLQPSPQTRTSIEDSVRYEFVIRDLKWIEPKEPYIGPYNSEETYFYIGTNWGYQNQSAGTSPFTLSSFFPQSYQLEFTLKEYDYVSLSPKFEYYVDIIVYSLQAANYGAVIARHESIRQLDIWIFPFVFTPNKNWRTWTAP